MTHGHAHAVSQRPAVASRRMARRLLSGAGAASLTAYRHDGAGTGALMVVHALDTAGRVLVAGVPRREHAGDGQGDGQGGGSGTDVRLDVVLEAADPAVRVTTASAHLLGTLRWLEADECEAVLAGRAAACHCPVTGEDPLALLAEMVAVDGGRLGVIDADRVVVHDALGARGHRLADVLDPEGAGEPALLWAGADEAWAQREVAALGQASLEALCEGVRAGDVPGLLCSTRPADAGCHGVRGRTLCVDVAPGAVTLMHVGRQEVSTLQVWLPGRVRHAAEVVDVLRAYVADAVAADLLRL